MTHEANNGQQTLWTFVLRRLCAVMLSIWSAIGILSLIAPQARAANILVFFTDGATIFIMEDGEIVQTITCPKVKPPPSNLQLLTQWDICTRIAGVGYATNGGATKKLAQRLATRTVAQASGTTTPTLSSSTPGLPFLGNSLVVVSYVLNAATVADATAAYEVGLRRQSDCSLMEDFFLPGASTPETPNGDFVTSLPGAQNYFHTLSGLTTTPDVFATGCAYPILGQPSSASGLLLGKTADGAAIGAAVSGSLRIVVTDTTTNTFTTTTLLSSTANPSLSSIATADVNGDGMLDLVATFATDPANQKLSTVVFLGNGDGTFKPGVYYDIPGDVTIDDVDGDDIPDIVICGSTPGITTLIGKGDGTFTPTTLSATSIHACAGAAGQIVTGDFNGDRKKDLLVAGVVLLGNGDGTFTVGTPVTSDPTFNFSSSIAAVAVGDLNKDGKLDVVVSQPGFAALYYGKGDGTFTAGPRYSALPDYMQVSITDIDGDGNLDIVLGTSSGGIYTDGCCGDTLQPPLFQILMGRGDGTFVDSIAYNQGKYGNGVNGVAGPQVATADFNGDGKPDVLVFTASNTGSTGTLSVLPGDGTGKLGTPITSSINIGPTMLVTASINKDGKADAVIAGGADVSVLLNQGNGTFAGEQDYTLPSPVVSLVTGDFNGDGLADVAVGVNPGLGNTGASGVYVLLGKPDGTLAAPVKIDSSLNPTGLAAADINGDGKTDLIVADQGFFAYVGAAQQVNGALHVYLANATGFTSAASPTTTATNYSVVALGDLNGDGKLDLIVGGNVAGALGTSTPSVYTLLGNGNGTFQAANATALASNYGIGTTSIALADFNKDGHLDVAVGDATAFTSVLLGNGDGTLTPTLLTLGQQPLALAAVDLNGDGFPELLVGAGSGNLAVFMNANAWTASTAPATFTLASSSAAGTVAAGQSATTTITLTPSSGFTGAVSLSCSGLPTGAACSFSPASVSVNGAAATSTLTITTTARTAMNSSGGSFNPLLPGGLLLAGFGVPLVWRRRRDLARLSSNGLPVLLLISAMALPSCGGGSSAPAVSSSSGSSSSSSSSGGGSMGTPAGTYTVTITATGGSVTQTTTYSLKVN